MTRFVYLDEAGISNPDQEPWLVVAGFIVHADDQWKSLERYMGDMIEDLIPPERRDGFYFHAMDIWSGNKKGHFPKEMTPGDGGWSGDRRWKVLEELVSLPSQFRMQIVLGIVDRRKAIFSDIKHFDGIAKISTADQVIAEQTSCYFQCALQAEKFMREAADENEVAILIAEHADAAKPIKALHNWIRDPKEVAKFISEEIDIQESWKKYLPLERIVETAHFANKTDSLPLQLADTIAFVIKRHLSGKMNSEPLYERLTDCMMMRPIMDDQRDEPKSSVGDEELPS